jgi:hypothetical protein
MSVETEGVCRSRRSLRVVLATVGLAMVVVFASAQVALAATAEPTELKLTLSSGGQSGEHITIPAFGTVESELVVSGKNIVPTEQGGHGLLEDAIFSDSQCRDLVASSSTEFLPSMRFGVVGLSPGTYYWTASYSGDSENLPSSLTCGAATVTVEPALPTSIEQCKSDGWKNFGTMFKNQGQCVKFVKTGR